MKTAISLPDDVFERAEQLARRSCKSRSQLYSDALAQYLSARGSAEVTARLNSIYSANTSALDPAVLRAQTKILADEAW